MVWSHDPTLDFTSMWSIFAGFTSLAVGADSLSGRSVIRHLSPSLGSGGANLSPVILFLSFFKLIHVCSFIKLHNVYLMGSPLILSLESVSLIVLVTSV